jgi:hypothetical protein
MKKKAAISPKYPGPLCWVRKTNFQLALDHQNAEASEVSKVASLLKSPKMHFCGL